MKQTGYIHEYRETDYDSETTMFGAIDVMPSGDWTPHAPKGERQSIKYKFDTMSCTSFSAHNTIETYINYLIDTNKFSEGQKQALSDFFIDGEFNISDRFTAIMGGTTRRGASFQQIWDSIRKNGILPEKDLPFGGESWEEYHDKSAITEAMKAKAKAYLKIMVFAYSKVRISRIESELKQFPLQIAIPKPGTHAVELLSKDTRFDTYKPFIRPLGKEIHYAIKPFIYIANVKPKTESSNFSKAVKIILENEGGYVNDPRDPGGETNMGISKRAYPKQDIKNMTKSRAKEIYHRDYWNKIKADSMPYEIGLQVFDMAVNTGIRTASKLLQKVVGTTQDGIIGKITLGAIKSTHKKGYLIERLAYYVDIKNFDVYGKGWINRALKVYKFNQ